jgi:hypothetical protein
MRTPRAAVIGWLVARLARLRFPNLFLITVLLFVVNVLVPDAIPFVDELLLGLGAALLASLRKRGDAVEAGAEPPPRPRA